MPATSRLASAALLAALLATPALASAGTYVSVGMGGDPSPQGELELVMTTGDGSDVPQQRAALGWSFSRLAIEATIGRFGIGDGHATIGGVHGRLTLPLDGGLGAYGRFGFERAWLTDLDPRLGEEADGMAAGLGLEYRLKAPLLGQAAVWAEVSEDRLTFANDEQGGARMWTVGASLGI